MRIGIVAYWFNRGQAVVARQIRATLDELGHETFVLARPTRKTNIKPGWVDTEGVWAQERVTAASDYLIPGDEYLDWAETTGVRPRPVRSELPVRRDRPAPRSGVRTIGRFVWEHFSDEHVEPAGRAFDRIYCLTACERERYAEMGIETPRVRWGCSPELVAMAKELESPSAPDQGGARSPAPPQGEARGGGRDSGAAVPEAGPHMADGPKARSTYAQVSQPDGESVSLLFPGGFMSKRKPLAETIAAFRATSRSAAAARPQGAGRAPARSRSSG